MNWFDVVKQPKLRTSSNVTTRLGTSEKEDDSCKKKLLAYFDAVNVNINWKKTVDRYTEEEICELIREMCAHREVWWGSGIEDTKHNIELFRKIVCGE